jgi:hypothetical protein
VALDGKETQKRLEELKEEIKQNTDKDFAL